MVGACIVRGPQVAHALSYAYNIALGVGPDGTLRRMQVTDAGALRTAPATNAPTITTTCFLPQGGVGCCNKLAAGQVAEATCDTATYNCYYRVASSYPDGGYSTVFPDGGGGYATIGTDSFLKSQGWPPRVFHMPSSADSLCAVSLDGGTFNTAQLYQ
jgi:hypothetical protein